MKPGDKFEVDIRDMFEPLIERLVTLEVDGEPVKARILSLDGLSVTLRVVHETVRE